MSRAARAGLPRGASQLRRVEVDVPALLAHDAPEQLRQSRTRGALGKAPVCGLRGPLVDRTPRHVDRRERTSGDRRAEPEEHGRQALLDLESGAHRRHPVPARRFAVGSEHRAECFAVPVLLECPHREERRHLVVTMRRGHEKVAQVADRVVLDVVHVADAPQRVVVERITFERREVDTVEGDRRRPPLVAVDVEAHGSISSRNGVRMTSEYECVVHHMSPVR